MVDLWSIPVVNSKFYLGTLGVIQPNDLCYKQVGLELSEQKE